jgi:dihydroxy-acid dehydratase
MKPTNLKLRSRDWFGKDDRWGLAHRAWLRAEGFSERVFEGKPVIGICNSWSELNNCNTHLRQVAEAVKRGVWEAGGFPLEFCTISLGEMLMKPTTIALSQLDGDGRRGMHSRLSAGRGGAALWM